MTNVLHHVGTIGPSVPIRVVSLHVVAPVVATLGRIITRPVAIPNVVPPSVCSTEYNYPMDVTHSIMLVSAGVEGPPVEAVRRSAPVGAVRPLALLPNAADVDAAVPLQ